MFDHVLSNYRFMIDKRRLQQVLLNLLSNARKFQKEGKIIVSHSLKRLKEQENDYALVVKVQDSGIGIDENEEKNLFKPFWRSERRISQQHNPRGNGLGLSICKQICKALGGDIELESSSARGSNFVFSMKVYKTHKF